MSDSPGPLCSNCSSLFSQSRILGRRELFNVTPGEQLQDHFDRHNCCLCAILSFCHERFLRNASEHIEYHLVTWEHLSPNSEQAALQFEFHYGRYLSDAVQAWVVPRHEITEEGLEWTANLPPSTLSEDSIHFARTQLEACLKKHKCCGKRSSIAHTRYPSRLLKIEGPRLDIVSLVDKSDILSGPYFTLSHCWGGMQPVCLTIESEVTLRKGISVSDLPKTFKDAISICNQVNIPYVWIDSMCIFQDNLKDWQKEAGNMCDVYSHALCNIAATSASDGSVGLFFQRNPMAVLPFWVHATWDVDLATDEPSNGATEGNYLIFPPNPWDEDLELGVLNQRAWVLQERLLSTRIMHFTVSQVFWECYERRSCEVFPSQVPQWMYPYNDSQRLRVILKNGTQAVTRAGYYTPWVQLRMAYSKCGLSKDSDKLPAISGIAQLISTITGDKFIAGLWERYMLQELCWSRPSMPKTGQQKSSPYPTTWRAPTWSWASINGYVQPGNISSHEGCSEYQAMATVKSIDAGTSASGQLKHASIIVRGKLLFASFSSEDTEDFSMTVQATTVAMEDIDGYLTFSIYLDDPEPHRPYQQDLVCLLMWSCECNSGYSDLPKECRMQALLLSPRNSGHHHYERVGILDLEHGGCKLSMEHATHDEQNVVIF